MGKAKTWDETQVPPLVQRQVEPPVPEEEEEEKEEEEAGAVQAKREPGAAVGDATVAGAQAAILRLQRLHGNQAVQRALDVARKGEGEAEVSPEVEAMIQRKRGGGQSLDRQTRAQMEPFFGANFRAVRVHTDGEADLLTRALSARAFTTRQDIFFRQGEYSPGSSGGRELLAHELTHVVQQGGAIRMRLMSGQSGDRYEQEAEDIEKTAARNTTQHECAVSSYDHQEMTQIDGKRPITTIGQRATSYTAQPMRKRIKKISKGRGYAWSGGGRLKDKLISLREDKKISISDTEIDQLAGVAQVETGGSVGYINTWDSNVVSFGFMQYTLAGSLQKLISKAPNAFARHGIKLGGKLFISYHQKEIVPGIQGAVDEDDLRGPAWKNRFKEASLDDEIIIAQVNKARSEIASVGTVIEPYVAHYQQLDSPVIRAILLELNNNRPAYLKDTLERTSKRIRGRDDISLCEVVSVLDEEIQEVYVRRNEQKVGSVIKKVNGDTPQKCRAKGHRITMKVLKAFGMSCLMPNGTQYGTQLLLRQKLGPYFGSTIHPPPI